jgi:hypothetical protein
VQQHEVCDDRVERPVGKRERLRIPELESKLRMEPTGERDHSLCDVDADHKRAAIGGRFGNVAGARRDV